MRFILFIIGLVPLIGTAQHTGASYELMNEVGTYKLVSLSYADLKDDPAGISYVIEKQSGDTIYRLDEYLPGYVGLSNDGKTITHLNTEEKGTPLDESIITFFRDGTKFDSVTLQRLASYELEDKKKRNRIPKSGWLRNDSLYHKMASNAFYVTDDKVFISFDNPRLMVFDMNRMFHIYSGNGANHFLQNYYSIPNAPYRTELVSEEYEPSNEMIMKLSNQLYEICGYESSYNILLKVNSDGTAQVLESAGLSPEKISKLTAQPFDKDLVPSKVPYWKYMHHITLKEE